MQAKILENHFDSSKYYILSEIINHDLYNDDDPILV